MTDTPPTDPRDRLVPRTVRPLDLEHDELMARAAAEHQARTEAEQARKTADRAAVLRDAADAVFALDYDVMVGEVGDENFGSMREAWDVGTIHATNLLRRLAAEAQPQCPGTETPTVIHAVPLPGSNGISSCCGRPPCEFVGERLSRDPDEVTCPGPAVPVQPAAADTGEEAEA